MLYLYTDTYDLTLITVVMISKAAEGNKERKWLSAELRPPPVPMNMTWYFSPSAACTWLTMMRVNVAPLRTRTGFSPIGWIAWSMRGLSLIN